MEQKTVLITGGTGLIGTQLSQVLLNAGYEVRILSRKEDLNAPIPRFAWDLEKGTMNRDALKGVHIIVHLAGTPIADKRWTDKRKKSIIQSRTKGVWIIAKTLATMEHQVEHFISSSGIGYYGARTVDYVFNESDKPYHDFVSLVCVEWEAAVAQNIPELGIPSCFVRTGVVLSNKGGALPKLAKPIRFGVGSALGSGKQWVPWIHLDDMCRLYLHFIENKSQGVFNAVCNDQHTNASMGKAIAKAMGKPFFMPNVPAFLLRMLFGEMAAIVLEGSPVSGDKILRSEFKFKYPDLQSALEEEFL